MVKLLWILYGICVPNVNFKWYVCVYYLVLPRYIFVLFCLKSPLILAKTNVKSSAVINMLPICSLKFPGSSFILKYLVLFHDVS